MKGREIEDQEPKIKELITKEQLLEQSGKVGQVEVENLTLGKDIEFVYDTKKGVTLEFGEKEVKLANSAIQHLVQEVGLPMRYVNNTPTDLIVPHLNYWFTDKMSGRKIRLLREKDVTFAIALSPRDEFITLPRLVDTIEKSIETNNIEGYHNPYFGWNTTNINVVMKRSFSVVKNDLLNVGIRFVHSLNETEPTRAYAYIFRQWCSNGAITMDKIKCWSKRMKVESFKKWVPSVVVEARKAFNEEEKRLKKLTEIPTDKNTADILDHLLAEGGIPLVVREAVRTNAIDHETKTLYDVYNVITQVATHSNVFEDHPAALPSLEGVASDLSHHSKLCPVCHHKVA